MTGVTTRRRWHIVSKHKDRISEFDFGIAGYDEVVELEEDEDYLWNCTHCSKGLREKVTLASGKTARLRHW